MTLVRAKRLIANCLDQVIEIIVSLTIWKIPTASSAEGQLTVAPFTIEITPPVGKPVGLGFVPYATSIEHPLFAKGVVLKNADDTYVLCALDLMEVHNGTYDFLRQSIAAAAQTKESRVALHCLHLHTAPSLDSDTQRLHLDEQDDRRIASEEYTRGLARKIGGAIDRAQTAWRRVTAIGVSKAKVDRVASNRRLLQQDGSIIARMSSTKDSSLHAAPEGLIDPWLRTISFFDTGDRAIVQMHYYATHPQSFYRDGRISFDVPGIARERLQKKTGVLQIYFTGCGGDVAMGKYNDGTRAARTKLAQRLYDAMDRSASNVERRAIGPIRWKTLDLRLPIRRDSDSIEALNRQIVDDPGASHRQKLKAAFNLAWIERAKADRRVQLSCLTLGTIQMLHLCGEPFVQFQLAAQQFRPDSFVVVAGYGDCGMGYLGSDRIYTDVGGIEQRYAFAGPCEALLGQVIHRLLTGDQ